jgi:Porin PorA
VRKVTVIVLLGFGAFLLAGAILLKWYAYPRLALAPLDQDIVQFSSGPNATIFDQGELRNRTTDLTSTRRVIGEVSASEQAGNNIVVSDTSVSTVDSNGLLLKATTARVPFDRTSGAAVDCCGANLNDQPIEFHGQVLKFPFNTQTHDYDFWDDDLKQATPAVFSGEESINGVTVYKFVQTIEPTMIDKVKAPPNLVGASGTAFVPTDQYYSNVRTLWVEPETGFIIKGQEQQYSTLRYEGEDRLVLTDVTIAYTDATVKDNTDTYGPKATQLKIMRVWGPIIGSIVGVLFVLAGSYLAWRTRPEPVADEDEADDLELSEQP